MTTNSMAWSIAPLCSHMNRGLKSKTGVLGCFPFGGFQGESVFLSFLSSKSHLQSMAHGPFNLSSQHITPASHSILTSPLCH